MTTNEIVKNYRLAKVGFTSQYSVLQEIVRTVSKRISSEKERDEARVNELTGVQGSETLKSLAQAEIDSIKGKKYAATKQEIQLVNDTETHCRQCLNEMRQLKIDYNSALKDERARQDQERATVFSDDFTIESRWIDSEIHAFDSLK